MKDFKRIDNERSAGADPALTALLRDAYAAPVDDGYWQGFEQRIMARLSDSPVVSWWSVMSEWRTAGAVATSRSSARHVRAWRGPRLKRGCPLMMRRCRSVAVSASLRMRRNDISIHSTTSTGALP